MEAYAGVWGFVGVLAIVSLALAVVVCIANWKLFEKAGEPGWSAIVPFYNSFQMAKIATGDTTISWAYLAVSGLNTILGFIFKSEESGGGALVTIISLAAMVFSAYIYFMFAKSFGQSTGICILSIFFGGIIFIILAFTGVEYVGPKGEPRFKRLNSYDNYGGDNNYNNYNY